MSTRKTMNKMILFPYAGGSAAQLKEFADALSRKLEADYPGKTFDEYICIEYPGHGSRLKEECLESFAELAEDAAAQLKDCVSKEDRLTVFGYSMGSITAYEMLAQKLIPGKTDFMFVASHEAPDVRWPSMDYAGLDDEAFFGAIQHMGGFAGLDTGMLSNRFFRRMYYDPLRADYRVIAAYSQTGHTRLDIPGAVFYSANDIAGEKIHCWDRFLNPVVSYVEMGGSHFFINSDRERLAALTAELIPQV